MAWKQPAPTKRYAIFYDGAWYGEGDTPEAAWAGVRRQLSPQHDRYGATLFAKIKRAGNVQEQPAPAPLKWTPETARQRIGGTFGT